MNAPSSFLCNHGSWKPPQMYSQATGAPNGDASTTWKAAQQWGGITPDPGATRRGPKTVTLSGRSQNSARTVWFRFLTLLGNIKKSIVRHCRLVRAWWEGYREGQEEGVERGNLGVMISEVYLYVKTYQRIHSRFSSSIKLLKSKTAKQW